jgi:hypothetical protein
MSNISFKTQYANDMYTNIMCEDILQQTLNKACHDKYDSIMTIISFISNVCGKKITCLTNFKNVKKSSIINFENLKKIVEYFNSKQVNICKKYDIKYSKIRIPHDDSNSQKIDSIYQKIISIVKKLLKQINYKLCVYDDKLSIRMNS